jgi:hypothetical protein
VGLNDKDIDDTMAADWAAIQEKYAGEEPEAPSPELEAPADSVEAPDTAPVRARDETGKFVEQPKEKAAPEPKEATPAKSEASAAESTPETAAQPGEVARDINRAPSTWKPTARAEWEKLPPAVRAEIHRRETDFLNGQSQLLPDAKFGKSVTEIIAPYRMLIEAEGGTPERAIKELMSTAALLRMGTPQQKRDIVLSVARQYGVDLGQQQQAQQPQHAFQDPRLDQLIGQLNQERHLRAQHEQQTLEGAVTKWMSEAGTDGHPKRPYLNDVINEVGALVPQIRQANPSLNHEQVLQQAYDTATWGNPEIRTLLLQQQAQGASQTRSAENQNRVREAKRAASVNVPRRASIPTPGKPGSLDETIAATARELGLIT